VEYLNDLEDVATRVEASHQLSQRYRVPPAPEKSLFPDLAYHAPRNAKQSGKKTDTLAALSTSIASPESKSSSRADRRNKNRANRAATGAETIPATSSSSETTAANTGTLRISNLKCWNCDGVGHISRNCAASPRLHCYRCGRAEVILRTGPVCSG